MRGRCACFRHAPSIIRARAGVRPPERFVFRGGGRRAGGPPDRRRWRRAAATGRGEQPVRLRAAAVRPAATAPDHRHRQRPACARARAARDGDRVATGDRRTAGGGDRIAADDPPTARPDAAHGHHLQQRVMLPYGTPTTASWSSSISMRSVPWWCNGRCPRRSRPSRRRSQSTKAPVRRPRQSHNETGGSDRDSALRPAPAPLRNSLTSVHFALSGAPEDGRRRALRDAILRHAQVPEAPLPR